jgi:dipeptidyl aminopeptidase/acylaminoacyl peptidase
MASPITDLRTVPPDLAQVDLLPDVVHAVVAEIAGAEPGRIGAHGWSYGGYLTLVALTRWPELFAAGATLAGMSDLRTFFAGTEPWMAAASVTEYGDRSPTASCWPQSRR